VDEIKVTNGDSIHIPAVITNRIFTVAFDSEIIEDGSAVYVSLVTQKGEQISSAIKVELLDKGYKGRIEVQLEILSESNERELFVVIVSMNNNVETILSSRSTKVDIAFAMDMDFGF